MGQKNEEYYSRLYDIGQSVSQSYEVRNKVAILTKLSLLNNFSNKKILEIGFGTGDLLKTLCHSNKNNFFVGLEFVSSAFSYFKSNNSNLYLCRGSIEKLPFHDGVFDIVICSHVIEHIKDDETVVTEITRVLKRNGSVVVAVPVYGESPLHYRQYTAYKLKSLFNKCGLTPVYLRPYGSILAKIIYKMINIFSSETYGNQLIIKDNSLHLLSPTKKGYYDYFVPFWLFLDLIDNFFARFDHSPIQIVGVFKNDEK